ncbi:MAG: fibronectin type III domain-containing protein [Gammaproteobacteria bacterium]
MKVVQAVALAGLLAFGSMGAAHAAVILVSPGQSIQSVVKSAGAGDTVRVLPGTYNQKVLIDGVNGKPGAFITLKADQGVTLSGSGLSPAGREGLITITNSNYVRVEGFDITNFVSAANTPVGILIEGNGSNLQIVNNRVYGIRNISICGNACPTGAHGIAVFGKNTTGVKDLLIQGNQVYDNVLQSSEAVVINGNVDGFEVLNNSVYNNNNIGFDFIGYEKECKDCGELDRVRNGVVRNNRAENNSSRTNPAYDGEGAAGGFYVDGGHHIVFEGNVSTNNDIGFEFASEHPDKATEDILMTNNFVYNNREAGVVLGGYKSTLGVARRIQLHNNSFYKNKRAATATTEEGWGTEVVFQYKVTNSTFSNNIFFGSTSASENYAQSGSGYSNNVWRTNLWWGSDAVKDGLPGTVKVGNPLFVAPATGNLNLQAGSPAINAGTSSGVLSGWSAPVFARYYPSGAIPLNGSTDINGQARFEGAIDLGADEFGTASGATAAPAAPSLLTATAASSSQVNLSWSDNAADETGVQVERSLDGSNFTLLATVPVNVTAYQDTGLAPATRYVYRVRAVNGAGNSAYSATVSATTAAASMISIVVDGNSADWAGVASLASSGGLSALKAYADANYLYVLVTGTIGANYALFINNDNVATTGFRQGYWSTEGSDYVLENGVLYKYTGGGTNWLWSNAGVAQSGIQAVRNAGVLELKIPRASLAGTAASIRLGVQFSNSSWTTSGVIPPAGALQAQFAF